MSIEQKEKVQIEENLHTISMFGYELIKEDLLRELLGADHQSILYWAGKSLARKYPVSTIEALATFFSKASWGQLKIIKEKKSELHFELTSSTFVNKKQLCASLEAGFLAEQLQQIKGCMTEARELPKTGKNPKIVFHVKWDNGDKIVECD